MQGLKSQLNRAKTILTNQKTDWGGIFNVLTILAFTLGIIALVVLIWLYVRPIQTASIKVPVATDQASYYPGEDISGIFFGDIYYNGEVRVLREVFCKNYKGIIAPPAGSRDGDFFSTQSRPRHLEGENVVVGNLPSNVPVGSNCVLQFTNIYTVQTPFGVRHLEYQYYTQNFAIVTKERRQQLECESSGRKACNYIIDVPAGQPTTAQDAPAVQSSPDTPVVQESPAIVPQDNPQSDQEPAPRTVERCAVDIFGLKIACSKKPLN